MISRCFRPIALVAGVLLCAAPAHASFHLWQISEVFTNADGTVQFIELFDESPGEEFVSGHVLRTQESGVPLQTLTIPSNLPVQPPDTTANHHFLVATPAFQAAAGIAPDYLIPAGFIELGVADAINWALVNSFPLAGLPVDGVHSLNRAYSIPVSDTITTDVPTPTNFAGEVGTIVPEPGALVSGLVALATAAALSRLAPRAG